MKAKEYLQQLQRLDTIIKHEIKEKTELRNSLASVSSPSSSIERIKGGSLSDNSSFSTRILRIIDLEAEIDKNICTLVNLKHLIIHQIDNLQNVRHIKLLYKRYVEFKPLKLIADEINFTYQYTKELHGNALQEFEKTYPNLPINT